MARRLDIAAVYGYGKRLSLHGKVFPFGLQIDPKTLKKGSGICRSTKAGEVVEGWDFRGVPVEINHANFTLRNCLLDAAGSHTVRQIGKTTGATIEFCTFDGGKRPGSEDFVYSDNPKDNGGVITLSTIKNNLFINAPCDTLNTNGGKIIQNVIIGAGWKPGGHADAISCHAGEPLEVSDNYIDYITPPDAVIPVTNAALKLVNHWPPPIRQVTVFNNVLLGGGYTIYCGSPDVYIHDNWIGGGKWGDIYPGDEKKCRYENNEKFFSATDDLVSVFTGEIPVEPPVEPEEPDGGEQECFTSAEMDEMRRAVDVLNTTLG